MSPGLPILATLSELLICRAWCLQEPWEFCNAGSAYSQTLPVEGTWGQSFLMLTSCVTVSLGRA